MKYPRFQNPGGCYFFTVVTEARRPLLIDHIADLRRAVQITQRRHPFEIDAIVVLPDHLHTIWRLPEDDNDPSKRWRVLKRLFSSALPAFPRSASMQRKRESGVWQRRFWSRGIRNESDWRRHLEYIHYNPVKHGYCASPADWPYSSFARMVAAGFYPADWRGPVSDGGRGQTTGPTQ
jgi:putative transposase